MENLWTTIIGLLLRVVILHTTGSRGELNESDFSDRRSSSYLQHHYPNLYFTAEDLPRLRAQAESSHATIYQGLVKHARTIRSKKHMIPPNNATKFNAHWNELYGNMLAPLAIYCALAPQDQDARDLAKLFMERFTSYDTWLVTGMENDEVPLAHTLLGYVTCFDCLHNSFTQDERLRYAEKILRVGTWLFTASHKAWWGISYIHNHVATNYMALLTAAIVLKPYYPQDSLAWEEKSLKALEATMKFLALVVDGSFQEGVSYGTYTMRSLTQFMLISERHFSRSYRTNIWLREYFNFLLYTIIPGFQFTVGFADSNLNWSFNPASQLAFLESYLHVGGRAHWLRNEIKRSTTQRGSVRREFKALHTEFLFYNNSFEAKPCSEVKLHVFSDWGVITYGGGIPVPGLFLALKCGHLHGRAINLLRPSLGINIRRGFVPGHEQPDQGSFVFVTKDQAVVTESRYGPKYTYLQNTLMFGPSYEGCTPPYLGQLGECDTWFNHLDKRTWVGRGELVGYSRENDVIFMSGDMTQVYDFNLGLTKVNRALIMVAPTVLVVVDIVRVRAKSVTTHASAFFHNSDFVFNIDNYVNSKNLCAGIGRYKMCWNHLNAETIDVSTKSNFKIPRLKYPTNFINITWKRSKPLTSTAYVFHGPEDSLQDLKLSKMKQNGINISLKLNSMTYNIILSTQYNPRLRRKLLGTNGYGKVYVTSINSVSIFHLGVKVKRHVINFKVKSQIPINQAKQHEYGYSVGFVNILVFAMLIILCFKLKIRRRFSKCVWIIAFSLMLIWSTTLYASILSSYKHFTSHSTRLPPYSTAPVLTSRKNKPLRAVLITGLHSSGMELARELFTTNPDFITIDMPSGSKESDAPFKRNVNLCEWTKHEILDQQFAKWWDTLLKTPVSLRKNIAKDYISLVNPLNLNSTAGIYIDKSYGALAAVSFKNPQWLYGMLVLAMHNQAPFLYIVRDPRSWVEQMLDIPNQTDLFLKEFNTAIAQDSCTFPFEIRRLREMNFATLQPHVALAHIWTAFATYAFRLSFTLPPGWLKIVHFEDIITSPRATADDVYSFLEMPFPAAVEHRILQVTKSGLYRFESYGTIEPRLCSWGKVLTKHQVSEIEGVCKKAMKNLGYI